MDGLAATLARLRIWQRVCGVFHRRRAGQTGTLRSIRSGKGCIICVVAAGIALAALFSADSAEAKRPGAWYAGGGITVARSGHTSTLLRDGKILVAGGYGRHGALASAEVYDPARAVAIVIPAMSDARGNHTATLLPNGDVLVAGGVRFENGVWVVLSTAEIYDRSAGTWRLASPMNDPRYNHTATLLQDGKVLVAGGRSIQGDFISLATVEIYDPATERWTLTEAMHTARDSHSATLLSTGQVLVTGGSKVGSVVQTSAELYDPSSGTWSQTGAMGTPRVYHSATLLPSGKVLVAGGQNPPFAAVETAELYDPIAGVWSPTASMRTSRMVHTATLLNNGKVLVTGGMPSDCFCPDATVEIFDPTTAAWSATSAMSVGRTGQSATLLNNGNVVVVGGYTDNTILLSSAEIYKPSRQ